MLFRILFLSATSLAAQPTAHQIIEQIKAQVGVPWNEPTVDTIKAGDPSTPITGIATTMMATHDVLVRAAAAGHNLIITHEPTFYSHADSTATLQQEQDPVWAAKDKFIRDHHLVVFRFHDYWHRRRPDGVLAGVTRALGWAKFQNPGQPSLFTLPPTTLDALATQLRKSLNSKIPRVIGDRHLRLTKAALLPGASGSAAHRKMLQRDDVEVLIIGEVPEWETIEYVADAQAQGKSKALVLLGHIPSEQAGMEDCAAWLATFIKDVKIAFIPTIEPFWMPR